MSLKIGCEKLGQILLYQSIFKWVGELTMCLPYIKLLLSGKNKLKALYLFIHRCCSRFTYPWAWFSVLNCTYIQLVNAKTLGK